VEQLQGASHKDRILALPGKIEIEIERLARDKHSSLFSLVISGTEKALQH
jgi:hypothetical protein